MESVGAEAISTTAQGDPLQTKYYCQVEIPQLMKTVMELKPRGWDSNVRVPLRYVLVIDVSGSMNERMGSDHRTLLQRVQLFAELAVRKISEEDSLAIVTFASDVQEDLPMRKMTRDNKGIAKTVLRNLFTRGNTNLELGLMGALQVISRCQSSRPTRDCIILFTDGEANEGETNPKKLVAKYRKMQSKLGRGTCVPVSAFTIGGYHPDLLIEISRQLGCESFYWLNDEQDFEVDLLIPFFQREITYITDVRICLESARDCYFDPVDQMAPHFVEAGESKVKVTKTNAKKGQKKKRPTRLRFFIHSLPDDSIKHIPFKLALPWNKIQELNGTRIVNITVNYLDANLRAREIRDFILLHTTSLWLTRNLEVERPSTANEELLKAVSAFTVYRNIQGTSWSHAQEVILKIAEEDCRYVSLSSMVNVNQQRGSKQPGASFQEAFREINQIRKRAMTLLADDGQSTTLLEVMISEWTTRVNHANDILANHDARNFSRISSMVSSIATESPTSGGVFTGKQPFMSKNLEEKLEMEKKIVETTKLMQSGPEYDIRDVMQRIRKAASKGDADTMEKYLKILKSLALIGNPVDEDFLTHTQLEIDHRLAMDELKEELSVAISEENIALLDQLIGKTKGMVAQENLTSTLADSRTLERANRTLDLLRRQRALRAEIANLRPSLKLAMIPRNVEKISSAIEKFVHLKNAARDLENVFTESDKTLLNSTISSLGIAKKMMDQLYGRLEVAHPDMTLPPEAQNYEKIKEAVAEMILVRKDAETFEGLFTKSNESDLQRGMANLDDLEQSRKGIRNGIAETIPDLSLQMLPGNYEKIRSAVEQMKSLRQRALEYNDIFTEEHECVLENATANESTLRAKMNQIMAKISSVVRDVGLPMLPNNLNKIKAAVDTMTEAREEAKGFDGVFSEEDAELLENGSGSVAILENRKAEVRKALDEAVPQIGLSMVPEHYEDICRGIDTMNRVSSEAKGFDLYLEEYEQLRETANFNKEVLKGRREKLIEDIKTTKSELNLPMIPDSLNPMKSAVMKLQSFKSNAVGYRGVFTDEDEAVLFEGITNTAQLERKVEASAEARDNLEKAVRDRSFIQLGYAIERASRAPFIEREELKEPRRLWMFLDPKRRRSAVKNGIREEDIAMIEEGLLDMRDAKVVDDELEKKANRVLSKLRKRERKREKERRRREREEARRRKEIKKLTNLLSSAIGSRDLQTMEEAYQEYESSAYNESDVPIAKEAKELLEHLRIEEVRNRLLDAIRRRDADLLLDALIDADYGGFIPHMEKEYEEAKKLLLYLREMMRLRDAISKMTRSAISEVHGYPAPPRVIKKIMAAIYIILGESPKHLKDWPTVQGLLGHLGRDSITKRVQRFRTDDVTPEVAEQAGRCLKDMNLEEVEEVSKVAATFYAWGKYVVKEIAHKQEREEEARKKWEEESNEKGGEKKYEDDFETDEQESHSSKEEALEEGDKRIPANGEDAYDDNDNQIAS